MSRVLGDKDKEVARQPGESTVWGSTKKPLVGVGKRGAYHLVLTDLPRQHSFRTTLRFTGPVPADSRQ